MNNLKKYFDVFVKCVTTIGALFAIWNVMQNNNQIKKVNYENEQNIKLEQSKNVSVWNNKQADKNSPVSLEKIPNVIANNSNQSPVYKVFVISIPSKIDNDSLSKKVSLTSEFNSYKYLETLPPGKIELSLPTLPNAMGGVHGVPIIFFTDFRNVEWYRDQQGRLMEYPKYETFLNKNGITPPYL
ncbi:hypothetical protein JKN54_000813 [Enterococcus faecalis]|nr:hypothetical protein [Enterococcus faecalis]